MQRRKRFFLIGLLSLAFILTGSTWYILQCSTQMAWSPFTGPQHADAEQQYTCGMHPMIITDEPGTCPICSMDLTPLKAAPTKAAEKPKGERKIKYWVAPMDPTYIRDEAGESPMGMDLVPVYEDEAAGGAIISIDPVVQQNMGVRTATVEPRNLHRTIRTVGRVDYNEAQQYSVNAKIDGWIERLHVDQTGQVVKKGDPLLELYSPKLVSAQEEYLLALRNRNQLQNSSFSKIAQGGERLLESSRKRLKFWDISDRQIQELERSGEAKKELTLYAPFEGIVKMKMAYEGQHVNAGQELFQLADISKVWVYADIYEYQLPWIKVGQKATIKLPYVDGEDIAAQITYIYPYVEPKTRTVKARIEFQNPDFKLKPDMYVNVHINGQELENVLTVPVESVIHSGEEKTVFVALGDGKFEPRHVRTGVQNQAGYVEIKQGLLEGERIVTSAQFMFDSESKLREAIQKMMAPQEGKTTSHDAATEEVKEGPGSLSDEETEKENLEDLF